MPRYHGTTESIRHPNRFAPRLFRYPASDTRWLAADAMQELGIVNESARETGRTTSLQGKFISAKMTGKSVGERNEPRQVCLQEMDRLRRDRVDTSVRAVDVCARRSSQKS